MSTESSVSAGWKMDEFSSGAGAVTRVAYIGGSAIDLTDTLTVASGTGLVSNAADFERGNAGEKLSCADNAAISTPGSFTIEGWIKPESSAVIGQLYLKGTDIGTPGNYAVNIWRLDTTRVQFLVSNGTTEGGCITATNVANGVWVHLAFRHTAGSEVRIFLNGVSDASAVWTGGCWDDAQALSFGARADGTTRYDGMMQYWHVFQAALLDAEIVTRVNSGTPLAVVPAPSASLAAIERRIRGVGRGILMGVR